MGPVFLIEQHRQQVYSHPYLPTMKVILTTIALAMIVYVQGQDDCGKVACDLYGAFLGCTARCGGSGAADANAAYVANSGCWDDCGRDEVIPSVVDSSGKQSSYVEACLASEG